MQFVAMKDFIIMIFGEYTPRMMTVYSYVNGQEVTHEVLASGIASLDIEYILGVLFGIVFYTMLVKVIVSPIRYLRGKKPRSII